MPPSNPPQNTRLSVNELLALVHSQGFSGQHAVDAVAVALAESGGNPGAQHVNTGGSLPGSIDRGLFQINSQAHPEVSDACAYDAVCATNAAFKISDRGTSFSPWTSNWTVNVAQVEKAQKTGKWKQFSGQFSGAPTSGTGAQQGGASQTAAGGGPNRLFNCGGGGSQALSIVTLGIAGGSVTGGVGCYIESALLFTVYSVGGLILIGAGVLLLAKQNPIKAGVKGAMMAVAPEAAVGGLGAERLALQQQREARLAQPRPPSRGQVLAEQKETRIAARQQRQDPISESMKKAEASFTMSKGTVNRANAYATRQRAKQGAMYTGDLPDTILGVKVPRFETPGVPDPSKMKG